MSREESMAKKRKIHHVDYYLALAKHGADISTHADRWKRALKIGPMRKAAVSKRYPKTRAIWSESRRRIWLRQAVEPGMIRGGSGRAGRRPICPPHRRIRGRAAIGGKGARDSETSSDRAEWPNESETLIGVIAERRCCSAMIPVRHIAAALGADRRRVRRDGPKVAAPYSRAAALSTSLRSAAPAGCGNVRSITAA
jgi:hypothetical protein